MWGEGEGGNARAGKCHTQLCVCGGHVTRESPIYC
jgi:hypothetical protein